MKRRKALGSLIRGMGVAGILPGLSIGMRVWEGEKPSSIRHSVCRWCFRDIPLEEFCEAARELGISSIELTTPQDWPVLRTYGLDCAMATHEAVSLTEGFNDKKNHGLLQKQYRRLIDQASEAGIQNVIVFSGNRKDMSDEEGLENCALGLDSLLVYAQRRGITLMMELLNSKVDHPDYQCDRSDWGVALVQKLGQDNFKLLYDIYHMQIMEGNIISTIQKNKDYIGHYHTAGVPGRHEIDQGQELNYPAIIKAIVETGFEGYVAQEFIPIRADKIASLGQGIDICSI